MHAVFQISCSAFLLLPLRNVWGGIFTNDHNVRAMTAKMTSLAALLPVTFSSHFPSTILHSSHLYVCVNVFMFAQIFDGIQVTSGGVIRGLGKQKVILIIITTIVYKTMFDITYK